jgi:hypothetical protein
MSRFPLSKEIKNMDLEAFERRIEQVRIQRDLEDDEVVKMKIYRRMIKNRMYAQTSRIEKKRYVTKLEKRVDFLEAENARLRKEMARLLVEKRGQPPSPIMKNEPPSSHFIRQEPPSPVSIKQEPLFHFDSSIFMWPVAMDEDPF